MKRMMWMACEGIEGADIRAGSHATVVGSPAGGIPAATIATAL